MNKIFYTISIEQNVLYDLDQQNVLYDLDRTKCSIRSRSTNDS